MQAWGSQTVTLRALCAISDIDDGGTLAFAPAQGGFLGLFALRQGDDIQVFINSCPHIGVALDWLPNRFLSTDGRQIVCAMHGARFRLSDGLCVEGPCLGDRLEAVMIEIKDGMLYVPQDAGL
jgi:nitrite reductase/ring-hydroxylating ferredoxin subunit